MAAKGGGSWKVAYADFVTAMMAFFLVMWIGAQDAKTRQSVANYFVDPSGVAKKPANPGATIDSMEKGAVPGQQDASFVSGRSSYDETRDPSKPTAKIANWLKSDEKRFQKWKEKARAIREAAATSPEIAEQGKTPGDIATKKLADALRVEFTAGFADQPDNVYRDLLFALIDRDVNWPQIAQDLLK
jgi:flagellar motor protein MotB